LSAQQIRMQVALEKTIQEFNMWQSMTRKSGAPWEHLFTQYKDLVAEMQLTVPAKKGDIGQVSSTKLWRKLISRLEQKEYEYDVDFYGDPDEHAEKVAFFFHSCLQCGRQGRGRSRTRSGIAGGRSVIHADAVVASVPGDH
jgi:hypothetical protein